MKRLLQRAAALFLYVFFLLYITGFKWKNLLDIRGFCSISLGICLLSIPQVIQYFRDRKGTDCNWKDFFRIFIGNSLPAAYITTAVFLMTKLNAGVRPEQVAEEIALAMRPFLYGLFLHVLFREEESGEDEANPEGEENQEEESMAGKLSDEAEGREPEKIVSCTYTAEEICYFFRSRGLTAREAEVAKLLYQEYTNREIAAELFIAETTVKKHVTHIMEKLAIEQRGQVKDVVRQNFRV